MSVPVIVGISGPALTAAERDLFARHPPAGVILFARNIETPAQLTRLTWQLRAALTSGAKIMVDQEGGRVARLRAPYWHELPAAGTLKSADEAYLHGRALGAMAHLAGFDMVAAPVLDLRFDWADQIVGDRGISDDPAIVAALGGRIAAGILAEGVTPVMKHIPGHGRAKVDSHLALPRVDAADLSADFYPFMANNTLPWAMTAHIVYEAYDPERPATLSATVIREVIRGKIGFAGTLVSDDLAMGALSGTPAARALGALQAGCDVALYCSGDFDENARVLEAVARG